MPKNETYKLRYDYERLYIRNMSGEYLDTDELSKVIRELSSLRDLMVGTNASQLEIYGNDVAKAVILTQTTTQIEYPFTNKGDVYTRGKSRKRLAPRLSGVYFLQVEGYDHLVKIGHSIDLYARTKQLWHDYRRIEKFNDPSFHVLAFVHTTDGYVAEQMFHRFFHSEHVDGEWFHADPVKTWLQGLLP